MSMSDTYATTAAPIYARKVWADDNSIFVEIPAVSGPPFIQKFSKTEGGLSKALALISIAHKKDKPTGGTYKFPTHPLTKRGKNDFSPEQRARARDILRKLKIV